MTLNGNNEFLDSEHLAQLGAVFEGICAALKMPAGSEAHEERRTRLASILLQLYALRQLDESQLAHSARRLLRQSCAERDEAIEPSLVHREASLSR